MCNHYKHFRTGNLFFTWERVTFMPNGREVLSAQTATGQTPSPEEDCVIQLKAPQRQLINGHK